MKNIRTHASLYVIALALIGQLLTAVPTPAAAQDATLNGSVKFNPPPCDFKDTFYRDNGLDPTQVVGRFGSARLTGPPATGNQVNWVADRNCGITDPERRNFRILATTGGFTDDGSGAPNAFISILGFITNQTAFETSYARTVGGITISINDSQNPRGVAMQDLVSNFEAYALVKQRLPDGTS